MTASDPSPNLWFLGNLYKDWTAGDLHKAYPFHGFTPFVDRILFEGLALDNLDPTSKPLVSFELLYW